MHFGIMTPPSHVGYDELLGLWESADATPEIEHAWLFDHLFPISGDRQGPIHEAWTLLAALAAKTSRLRLGTIVTSNRIRPPALLARIAAEVDIVSGGRMILGIGAGSRTDVPWARAEYDAHGLPYVSGKDAMASLAEACEIIPRLWTADEPFDYEGQHHTLVGAWCNPKPVQSPPPLLIAGRSPRLLRIAARHASLWNMPGPPANSLEDVRACCAQLDANCEAIGRDPKAIERLGLVSPSFDAPATTLQAARELIALGFTHIVFPLAAPYPADAARYIAEELIAPLRAG